jgi:hypothetical protein
MRYLVDTEAKVIRALTVHTVEDLLRLRVIVAKMKGYTLELSYEPSEVAFKPAKFPDPNMDKGPQA